jgi:glycosyltransferase involved in cell wall biosynthesis
MSCRGWSSDAYWAARACHELAQRGHTVTLGCRAGTDARVIARAREEGVDDIVTFELSSGVKPHRDVSDVRRLLGLWSHTDVVHVHRGKEHWLAAVANRMSFTPRPLVRTRHIAQAVRPHRLNRWLYGRATALTLTVTEAIRRQYLAAGIVAADRVVTLPGGADTERFRPTPADPELRENLGGRPGEALIGVVGGLRAMKGHRVVIEAAQRLIARGLRPRFVFAGRGSHEAPIIETMRRLRLTGQFTIAGFVSDVPAVLAALDVALYVPLESDGMSRMVFEYLAAGRALIASRVGVVPEVLRDGEHALLVHAGDADALADALARLVTDAALRDRLATAGRRLVVERYSGTCLAAALEEHYGRLVRQ